MTAKKREEERALDHLALMIQTIGEDGNLLARVNELRTSPDTEHDGCLLRMIAEMEKENEDPAIVKVFKLFADKNLFQICVGALVSCDYLKAQPGVGEPGRF